MTLVDTSVWVDHFRRGSPGLSVLLEEGDVLCHPFVIGEIACGQLKNRLEVLALLGTLPTVPMADDSEVLDLIQGRNLHGSGLGWIDMHLLASAILSHARLWTMDKRLRSAAKSLAIDVLTE